MNAATILNALRAYRPAISTVLVLALLAGLVQTVGRAPSVSIAEPPAFTIFPQGGEAARLGPLTVTFAKTPDVRAPAQLFQVVPEPKVTFACLGARTGHLQPDFPGLV